MAWTAVALVIAIIVLIVVKNYRVLLRYRYLAMLAGVVLLTMPLWPGIGRTVNGATLWVNIGGLNFQPGEIAKARPCDLLRRVPRDRSGELQKWGQPLPESAGPAFET